MVDGVLYVSNVHSTYAESSGGLNGFITANDPVSLEVLWRSEPLLINSENFVVWATPSSQATASQRRTTSSTSSTGTRGAP